MEQSETFLKPIEMVGKDAHGHKRFLYECACGVRKVILAYNVKTGNTISCGCHHRTVSAAQGLLNSTHGNCKGGALSAEYRTWQRMKDRCGNPGATGFENYGGRGIIVCERWLNSFQNFLDDMGCKPSANHSIDRINNNGNYEPSNCQWATKSEQSRNQRTRAKRSTAIDNHQF